MIESKAPKGRDSTAQGDSPGKMRYVKHEPQRGAIPGTADSQRSLRNLAPSAWGSQHNCRRTSSQCSANPPAFPRLILHADDFGMSPAVNRGILAGFSEGLLTSTSLLANAPGFTEAIEGWNELQARHAHGQLPSQRARESLGDPARPFDLGVHLNLTQGRPLTGGAFPKALLDHDGCFLSVFRLLPRLIGAGRRHRAAIRDELCVQIDRVLESGIAPTHLNGHQYVEMLPVVADIVPELLDTYRIGAVRVAWEPHLTRTTLLRRFQPAPWGLAQVKRLFAFDFLVRVRKSSVRHPDRYFGTAHAGRIDVALIGDFLGAGSHGVTEIGIHPGTLPTAAELAATTPDWHDPLASDRPQELACLTSTGLVDLLASRHIELTRLAPAATAIMQDAAA